MTLQTVARRRALEGAAAAMVLLASAAAGQRGGAAPKKDTPEFTRQGLLIVNFTPRPGATMKLGRQAANAVRSRVEKYINKREVEVIDGGDVEYKLARSGYDPDTIFELPEMRAVGKFMRADEFILGNVSNGPAGPRIAGQLIMFRDERLKQPLLEVSAPKLDSAAVLFARSIAAARAQLAPERRCENALREGNPTRAIEHAREGIAAYSRGAIARTCLVWALRQGKSPTTELLTEAEALLAIDSTSPHGLEAAAVALDSLRRRDQAATHWLRLAATDTENLDLSAKISYALLDGGNAKRAEPFIVALVKAHPEDLRFLQQEWRAAYDNKNWALAIAAGEILVARDSVARADSVFWIKLGQAYHSSNMAFKAIETLAHGVANFPKDARMYSLYTQYIRAEADTVVPRGLALFPKNADLLTISAKDLRSKGKVAESLDATKRAIAIDTTLAQGHLMIAQLEFELNRPDSALIALRAALSHGEDSALVAAFALSKGNALYRAANGTKTSTDFATSLRMIAFADTVKSSEQSRFLTGAAALGVAQSALTEAAKLTEKSESCRLARWATDLIPLARSGLQAGENMFGDAAKQSLDYLNQLDPFAQQQLKLVCE